jgi:uncharacterized protein YkwD
MGRHALAPVQLAVAAASLVLAPAVRVEAAHACPDSDLRPTQSNLPRVEAAMVCLLNVERRRDTREPVTRNRRLERSAAAHTKDMTARGYFGHRRSGGPSLLDRIRAAGYLEGARSALYSENLGYGPPERATPEAMTSAFMLSESHRKTMLYGRFRNVGIGSTIIGPHPAFYADYPAAVFTIDFGRRYERRRRCRARPASEQGEDSQSRSVPPRRWCRRKASS